MAIQAPYVKIQEYDLSQIIPNFKGITVATIIDSEKGEVNKVHFSTNERQFIEQAGKPNPQKYGTYIYSALNALQVTDKLYWARVDRGQTYATALVRSKIDPAIDKDQYGYYLEEPIVDPIVKPNGAMSKEQIESFVFPEYPRTREVGHFDPAVHLALIPNVGDTKFYIDNTSNIEVGDYVTFKDTTGMSREDAMLYKYYQVTNVGSEEVFSDWIVTTDPIPVTTPLNTEVRRVITTTQDIGATLAADAATGANDITVNDGTLWAVGDKISFTTDMSTGVYTITAISGDTLTLDSALTEDHTTGEPVYKVIDQILSYNYPVYLKYVDPADNTKVMVSSNDPIAEGDRIEINGTITVVNQKYQTTNVTNFIEVDSGYVADTPVTIGSEVYKLIHTDWEERDAFLVYSESPGEWSNKLAVAIRDSREYEKAFWVDVYYDGELVESHHVTREPFVDGYGRQMFIEDVINNQSRYIRVKNNPLMVDEEGNPTEPLKTLYYYKQRQKEALYYEVTQTTETVWDGDNYIRVNPADIPNIDVSKKIQLAGKLYDIAQITKSCDTCPYDTIVLKQAIDLGLDNLPPMDRKLDPGEPVKQSFDRAKIVDITIPAYADGETYTVKVTGHNGDTFTYSYTSIAGDDEVAVYTQLANQITADNNIWVDASVTADPALRLTADVAGNDYSVEVSSNMAYVVVQENARAWQTYPLEKVDGKVLPTATIGAIVTQNGITYIIRDAGANRTNGGDDGSLPTVSQFIRALDLFKNPEEIEFIIFMDAGVTDVAYAQAITEMCENRMDCIGLLSVSFEAQANPDIQKVVEYRQSIGIDSSYVALYSPWVEITDKYNDLNIFIQPESFACKAVVRSERDAEIWYPPFGYNRGKVNARRVYRAYTKGERDLLYSNEINTIRVHPNKGMAVWGQKTLQVQASATDRINVRLLLIVIEKQIRDFLEQFIGEINTDVTRNRIKSGIESFLVDIRARRGIYGFRVVCDESNNDEYVIANNEIRVDVYVEPVQGIEYPIARIGITNKGLAEVAQI